MLSFRLPKVTMTPFGSDVDPDVNCRNATSSGLMLGSSKLLRLLMLLLLLFLSLVPLPPRPLRREEQEEGDGVDVGRISSLTSGQWYGKSGQPLLPVATAFSLDVRRSLLTSGQRRIILGSQPYTTSWSLCSDFLRLAGLGGYTGTAMTPALMHPRNTAKKRSPKLKASTALSPLLKPSVTRSRCAICVERGRCVGQRRQPVRTYGVGHILLHISTFCSHNNLYIDSLLLDTVDAMSARPAGFLSLSLVFFCQPT